MPEDDYYVAPVDPASALAIMPVMEFRIRQLRQKRGLTQAQVAEAIGISQGMYAQLENGKRKVNVEHMEALSRLFRVHPQELIAREEDPLLAELREMFAKLTPDEQRMLVASARGLLDTHRSR